MGPIGSDPDEPGQDGKFAGCVHECGFCQVDVECSEGLFSGLGSQVSVHQEHYREVKTLPEGFRIVASSPTCAVQAIVHDTLPQYGTQFHPEYYDETQTDGRTIIQNSMKIIHLT